MFSKGNFCLKKSIKSNRKDEPNETTEKQRMMTAKQFTNAFLLLHTLIFFLSHYMCTLLTLSVTLAYSWFFGFSLFVSISLYLTNIQWSFFHILVGCLVSFAVLFIVIGSGWLLYGPTSSSLSIHKANNNFC